MLPTTLEYVSEGKSVKDLAESIGQHVRQGHFLIQNARILSLIIKQSNIFVLTRMGQIFLDSNETDRARILSIVIASSKIVSAIINSSGSLAGAARLNNIQISDFLISNVLVSKSESKPLQKITADRRASSVRAWIQWLWDYTLGLQECLDDYLE